MKFYLNGNWENRDQVTEVTNPYDNSIVDVVPKATEADIETALQSAVKGAASMAETTGYERFEILRRTADFPQPQQRQGSGGGRGGSTPTWRRACSCGAATQ